MGLRMCWCMCDWHNVREAQALVAFFISFHQQATKQTVAYMGSSAGNHWFRFKATNNLFILTYSDPMLLCHFVSFLGVSLSCRSLFCVSAALVVNRGSNINVLCSRKIAFVQYGALQIVLDLKGIISFLLLLIYPTLLVIAMHFYVFVVFTSKFNSSFRLNVQIQHNSINTSYSFMWWIIKHVAASPY